MRDINWGISFDITINGKEASFSDLTESEQKKILKEINNMKTIDLVSWLKNWFYSKEESYNKTVVDGLLASKSDNINTLTDIVLLNDGTINLKYVGDE